MKGKKKWLKRKIRIIIVCMIMFLINGISIYASETNEESIKKLIKRLEILENKLNSDKINFGKNSKSEGISDIAIGTEAVAKGGWGIAIGQSSKADNSTSIAVGYSSHAIGKNSLAIGIMSVAKKDDSIAYGRQANAIGDVALAIGAQTSAKGNHSSVFGFHSTTDSTAWNGTAIGRGAYIGVLQPNGTKPDLGVSNNNYHEVDDDTKIEDAKKTMNSTVIGFSAKSFGYQNTALGAGAEAFDTNTVAIGIASKSIGHYSNAFGKQAIASGKNAVAIGHHARSIGEDTIALGDNAITNSLDGKTNVNKAIAIGSHARVSSNNSIALGANSLANIQDEISKVSYLSNEKFEIQNGVVSVGNSEYKIGNKTIKENYRRIINVSGGFSDHDAVNVAQLKQLKTYVDGTNPFEYTTKANTTIKLYEKDGKFYNLSDGKEYTGNDVIVRLKNNLQLGNIKSSIPIASAPKPTPTPTPNNTNNDNNNNAVVVGDLEKLKEDITKTTGDITNLTNKVENNTNYIKTLNTKVDNISENLKKVDEKSELALSGISNAVAMTNLVQVTSDNKFNISASYGYYGKSHALAVGFSGRNDKGNFTYRLSGSVNNKGNIAVGAGFGLSIGKVSNNEDKLKKEVEDLRNEVKELKKLIRK